ncbi:hypothetical protein H6G52_00240 [Limnothrix sp. FACHB-881]|uniref:hypothetical protein n=1 Tax=Limnothrix sp. FACHB-881 TaxID=2692819 RepID=UPI001688D251|nr:hypothetical protein [Limnothrix sp. FACHB-881]MBD2633776.1 hypothetical protein [Limnothrix sp. FACHB-881]
MSLNKPLKIKNLKTRGRKTAFKDPLFQSGKQVNIGCFPTAILSLALTVAGIFLVHKVDAVSIRIGAFVFVCVASVAIYIFFKKRPWNVSLERALIWIGLIFLSIFLLSNVFFWMPLKDKQAEYRPEAVPVPCLQPCPAFYSDKSQWKYIPISALSTPVWLDTSFFSSKAGFRGKKSYSVKVATKTTSNELAILQIQGWCDGYGTTNYRASGRYERITILDKAGEYVISDSLSRNPIHESVDASQLGLYSEMPTWLFQELCHSILSNKKSP